MLKLIFKCMGALLILYAGAALGRKRGSAAMQRLQIVSEMRRFLICVQNELHYRCSRTETILESARKSAGLSVLPIRFAKLSQTGCTQNALDEALYQLEQEIASVTQAEERRVFRSALEMLGACPAEEEETHLAAAVSQLGLIQETLRDKAASEQRLYQSVGFSLGGAAALLLI